MLTAPAQAWTIVPDGLRLTVRLTPRSARDSLGGVEALADGRAIVKARVRAVPEDGKANAAAIRLLADALGVAAAKVRLEAGATARIKSFFVQGDGTALASRLSAALAQ